MTRLHSSILLAACIAIASVGAYAQTSGNTVFFTSKGDITFPFTPPKRDGTTGTIDNMVIGATTPGPINATAVNGPNGATAPSLIVLAGTSSASASAGGAARLHGGIPGATGVGGDATVRGGIGGATSGAGGLASLTGGAGTAGNSAGGLARAVGGAGQGSAVGGASQLTGGAGGATGAGGVAAVTGGAGGATSGAGAQATVTGGAGSAGNANGGSVVIAGGAANGSGIAGSILERGVRLVSQGAPAAKTVSATLTTTEVLAGIITVAQGGAAASAQQLPLATAMDTAIPDAAAGDAFDFSVINISVTAAEAASLTTNTGWTLVGDMDILANSAVTTKSAGRFRARKTGTGAWTLYRLS